MDGRKTSSQTDVDYRMKFIYFEDAGCKRGYQRPVIGKILETIRGWTGEPVYFCNDAYVVGNPHSSAFFEHLSLAIYRI